MDEDEYDPSNQLHFSAERIAHFSAERVVRRSGKCALSTPGRGELPRVGDEIRFVLRLRNDSKEYAALGTFAGYSDRSKLLYHAYRSFSGDGLQAVKAALRAGAVPTIR